MNIIVKHNQTLLDVALILYGSIDNAVALARANNIAVYADIAAGTELIAPDVTTLTAAQKKYIDKANISPATYYVAPAPAPTGAYIHNSNNSFTKTLAGGESYELPNINFTNSNGVTTSVPSMEDIVATPAVTPSGWYPPADWPDISGYLGDGDNGMFFTVVVYENMPNFVAFRPYFSGSATIDWGDGSTIENLTHNVKSQHIIEWDDVPSGATSAGYKLAVLKISVTGVLTGIDLDSPYSQHTDEPLLYNPQQIKHILLRSTSSSAVSFGITGRGHVVDIVDFGLTKMAGAYLCYGLISLKKLTLDFSKLTSLVQTFTSCGLSDFDWNGKDYSNITSFLQAFYNSRGAGNYMLNISIPACTNLQFAFYNCAVFSSVKLTNTSIVSNIQYAIGISAGLKHFEMDDCSAVTTTTGFINTNNQSKSLCSLLLNGLCIGIDISNSAFSASALNAFFTSLGTASGAQTITVTGNPGAATCDTSIATAKGFTVVT